MAINITKDKIRPFFHLKNFKDGVTDAVIGKSFSEEAKSSEYGLGKIDYEDEVSKWIKKYAVKGGMTVVGYVPSICEYLNYNEKLLGAIGLVFDKKG